MTAGLTLLKPSLGFHLQAVFLGLARGRDRMLPSEAHLGADHERLHLLHCVVHLGQRHLAGDDRAQQLEGRCVLAGRLHIPQAPLDQDAQLHQGARCQGCQGSMICNIPLAMCSLAALTSPRPT